MCGLSQDNQSDDIVQNMFCRVYLFIYSVQTKNLYNTYWDATQHYETGFPMPAGNSIIAQNAMSHRKIVAAQK